jgi:hypothetical protein
MNDLASERPNPMRWVDRLPPAAYSWLAASVAFTVLVYFFCPAFAYWRGMEVPFAWHRPEINRGIETLKMLADPFHVVLSEGNGVLRWRLLFPMLGHFLSLPPWLYLAIPHLGVVVTLAWVGSVMLRHGIGRLGTLLGMLIIGAASWTFVSTEWLGYFDSWYVLGLLAGAFHRSLWAVVTACLLTPWVDERFLVALPLLLLVRAVVLHGPDRLWERAMRRAALASLLAVMPFVISRGWVVLAGLDPSGFAQSGASHLKVDALWLRLGEGLLHGLRANWFLAAIFLLRLRRSGHAWLAAWLAAVAVGTLGISTYLAADVARNTTTLLPLALAGAIAGGRGGRTIDARLLPVLCLATLTLPARHVVTSFSIPIFYAPAQWHALAEPPQLVDPAAYDALGKLAFREGRHGDARACFDAALKLHPGSPETLTNRGVAHFAEGKVAEAERDFRAALALQAESWDASLSLARICAETGRTTEAIDLLEGIIAKAPAGWGNKPAALALLDACRGDR